MRVKRGLSAAVCLACLAALLPGCATVAAIGAPVNCTAGAYPLSTLSASLSPRTSATAACSPARTSAPSPTPAEPDATAPRSDQAVVVIASGSTARVTLYERAASGWKKCVDAKGCVGRAGITGDKREGDKKTPKGVYALTFVFGTDMPDTKMDFRQITDESYWVDDPESEYYNTWQEGYKGWKSAEKLSAYPLYYHYAVAVAYNADCTPGMGSAIFLHCKVKDSTSGCVAVPESALLKMLKRLDPTKAPVIIIAGSVKEAESYGIWALSLRHS